MTFFIVASALGVAVLAGPFGTYDTMHWPLRTAYWGAVIAGALVIGFGARAVMRALLGTHHPALFDIGASLILGIIFGPVILALRGWMDPVLSHADLSLRSITLNTTLIGAGFFVVRRQIGAETPTGYWSDPEPETVPTTRLHRRLSCSHTAEIHRLTANNHFVEVATSTGVETLRLRLIDAIEEMEPVAGLCTHRSHWVAVAAVTGVERQSRGKLFVILKNGDRVPVSRKYRPSLEAAGLIESAEVAALDQ